VSEAGSLSGVVLRALDNARRSLIHSVLCRGYCDNHDGQSMVVAVFGAIPDMTIVVETET
jgi:hypothetical protein